MGHKRTPSSMDIDNLIGTSSSPALTPTTTTAPVNNASIITSTVTTSSSTASSYYSGEKPEPLHVMTTTVTQGGNSNMITDQQQQQPSPTGIITSTPATPTNSEHKYVSVIDQIPQPSTYMAVPPGTIHHQHNLSDPFPLQHQQRQQPSTPRRTRYGANGELPWERSSAPMASWTSDHDASGNGNVKKTVSTNPLAGGQSASSSPFGSFPEKPGSPLSNGQSHYQMQQLHRSQHLHPSSQLQQGSTSSPWNNPNFDHGQSSSTTPSISRMGPRGMRNSNSPPYFKRTQEGGTGGGGMVGGNSKGPIHGVSGAPGTSKSHLSPSRPQHRRVVSASAAIIFNPAAAAAAGVTGGPGAGPAASARYPPLLPRSSAPASFGTPAHSSASPPIQQQHLPIHPSHQPPSVTVQAPSPQTQTPSITTQSPPPQHTQMGPATVMSHGNLTVTPRSSALKSHRRSSSYSYSPYTTPAMMMNGGNGKPAGSDSQQPLQQQPYSMMPSSNSPSLHSSHPISESNMNAEAESMRRRLQGMSVTSNTNNNNDMDMINDDDYDDDNDNVMGPNGLKPKRRRANPDQLRVLNSVLEKTFFPSTEVRAQLAKQLNMSPRAVQIWFQNKRQNWRTRNKGGSGAGAGSGGVGSGGAVVGQGQGQGQGLGHEGFGPSAGAAASYFHPSGLLMGQQQPQTQQPQPQQQTSPSYAKLQPRPVSAGSQHPPPHHHSMSVGGNESGSGYPSPMSMSMSVDTYQKSSQLYPNAAVSTYQSTPSFQQQSFAQVGPVPTPQVQQQQHGHHRRSHTISSLADLQISSNHSIGGGLSSPTSKTSFQTAVTVAGGVNGSMMTPALGGFQGVALKPLVSLAPRMDPVREEFGGRGGDVVMSGGVDVAGNGQTTLPSIKELLAGKMAA
ncbi:hypothetical protein HDU76_014116 [Blyttiomyces sp. JEL0837]|nr:hypothetical protein HDU76_014116 [Blyttiomyces sp. JEL0837]